MSDLNAYNFTGRLGADPEIRTTQSGKRVATLSVAIKDRDKTVWTKVTCWSPWLVEFSEQYLTTGSSVWGVGRITTDKYTDKNGQQRTSWGVTAASMGFNGPKPSQSEDSFQGNTPQEYSRPHQQPQDNGGWQQQPQQQQPQQQGWGSAGQETWGNGNGNGNGGGWNNA